MLGACIVTHMPRRSALRMLAALERWLPDDPFEDMVRMLNEGTAFAFSRFGDGEFNAVFGGVGANCDGHPYYPDLGLRLRKIVESQPDYLMGLQPLAVMVFGTRRIWELSKGAQWVLADALHNASLECQLDSFFDALTDRRTWLVGPEHLHAFSKSKGWSHQRVPAKDCWAEYTEILHHLENSISDSGDVVLFCASMMSNVLIDDLFRLAPENTYIDAGSVFDPYTGVISRAYHKELDSDFVRRMTE